jgi:cytidylate kinase
MPQKETSVTDLITIDGKRGTGKTAVAKGLSTLFACDVFELGPLFRFFAWRLVSEPLHDTASLANEIRNDVALGRLQMRMNPKAEMSNNELIYNGQVIYQQLWNRELDERISIIASDPQVVDCVCHCAAMLIASRRAIVVGREAGSRCFPSAALKIELLASYKTRISRKVGQLSGFSARDEDMAGIDLPEPMTSQSRSPETLSIDTTTLGPLEVLERIASLISNRLGWRRITSDTLLSGDADSHDC